MIENQNQKIEQVGKKKVNWATNDFHAGDVVWLHPQIIHCTLPNELGQLRISCDSRWHKKGESSGYGISKKVQ
jgi:hypothetical protein